jgi:hypothetical protein
LTHRNSTLALLLPCLLCFACLHAHAQGLGSLLAQYLAQQGAKVIVSARSEDKLQVQTCLL